MFRIDYYLLLGLIKFIKNKTGLYININHIN